MLSEEQIPDTIARREPLVVATLAAALLALNDGIDEPRHHVELRPMDLGRVVIVIVGVSFVCADEVGQVDLSARSSQRVSNNTLDPDWTHNAGIHAPLVFRRAIRYF